MRSVLAIAIALLTSIAGAAELQAVAASSSPIAAQATMLGSTWAGPRAVAVGDHGVVLLSDDRGTRWRQARSVPVSFTLTSVSFIDARNGWAVGHGGSILATTDGGENWQLQRTSLQEDRPLFAVHFFDAHHGVTVGLWGLVLTTDDGGAHWQKQKLEAMPGGKRADLNLLALFTDARGVLYATAERGQVLRSDDRGHSWQYAATGYKGSLWSGVALPGGPLLVGGQRGTLLRSDDEGRSWKQLPLATKSSITTIIASTRGVTLVGLDGLIARSADAQTFTTTPRPDGVAITSALATSDAQTLLFSRRGIVNEPSPRP
jgi:photosystem II stability/assembly factor-like uncharacterized protein